MRPAFFYLAAARQARLAACAWPDLAPTHKARARYWLAMARSVRPTPLP